MAKKTLNFPLNLFFIYFGAEYLAVNRTPVIFEFSKWVDGKMLIGFVRIGRAIQGRLLTSQGISNLKS